MKLITQKELEEMMVEGDVTPMGIDVAKGWISRGDGVAVYENQALDSAQAGHRKYASFGSPVAMLEGDEPPQRLPDTEDQIHWKYQLIAAVPTKKQRLVARALSLGVSIDEVSHFDEMNSNTEEKTP